MAAIVEIQPVPRPVRRRRRLPRHLPRNAKGTPPMVDPAPPLYRVSVVLDEPAYRDVAGSPFLGAEFGRLSRRGTGIRIAGENTVVELLPAGTAAVRGQSAGLVLSYETPGSISAARARLDDRGASPLRSELVSRAVTGVAEPQPWYHMVQPELDTHSPVRLVIAEAAPECFAALGAGTDGGRLTRRAYLDAVLGRPRIDLVLRDLAEVTVRLRADRARRLVATLEALGYAGTGSPDGRWLTGPDTRIRVVVDEAEPEGVLAIGLRLSRPYPHPHRFGESSVLTGEAWTFQPFIGTAHQQQATAGTGQTVAVDARPPDPTGRVAPVNLLAE
jgi:Family of unknown function (DUF5829)